MKKHPDASDGIYCGYINTKGEEIIPPEYYIPLGSLDMMRPQVSGGIIHVYRDYTDFCFNMEGELIWRKKIPVMESKKPYSIIKQP